MAVTAILTLMAFLLLFWALGNLNPMLAGKPERPFSWVLLQDGDSAAGPARILFRGSKVLSLHARGDYASQGARSQALVDELNLLFSRVSHPHFEVTSFDQAKAIILCDGSPLIEVLPDDVRSGDAISLAQSWQAHLDELICGKGWSSENCATCHIDRIDEVERFSQGIRGD
jgi:hypothetical protein